MGEDRWHISQHSFCWLIFLRHVSPFFNFAIVNLVPYGICTHILCLMNTEIPKRQGRSTV